jgi:hypothetical protein
MLPGPLGFDEAHLAALDHHDHSVGTSRQSQSLLSALNLAPPVLIAPQMGRGAMMWR